MNKKAYHNTDSVDVILFVIDINKGFGKGDQFILNKIKESNLPIFLLLNKIDQIKDKTILLERISSLKELHDFDEIIPISAMKNDNITNLLTAVKTRLEESEQVYSTEELTNVSTRFIVGEFVREKLLELTKEEIPHAISCYVETFEEEEDLVRIQVLIVVDRDNIKKIVIGKHGSMLKEVGSRARHDIEKFLGKKVFLETYVKTLKNWRDEERYFEELGLKDLEY